MDKVSVQNKKRLIIAFVIFCGFLLLLLFRTGYIQIVKGDDYQKKAAEQQTQDEIVEAKRGDILDRNGNKLAVSTINYAVWVRPSMDFSSGDEKDREEEVNKVVTGLSQILGKEETEIREKVTQDLPLIKVDKYLERDTADAIRNWVADEGIAGISISEENKRFYPLGNFASQVLGSVTDDNNGLSGLEMYYNQELSGVPGRWIQNKDVNGKTLIYGEQEYHVPENGSSLTLTIDVAIQNYAEQGILKTMEEQDAERVSCIVMNPQTGEILAMASAPSFDPNNARTPLAEEEKAVFDQMKEPDQMDYLNNMWRNPLVSDTYVPGSTMKLLTASMGLEEDLTTVNESFYSSGSIDVSGVNLKCWRYYEPHGSETMKEAVGNSCNPVFVQLAQRIGIEKYYDYLALFGIPEKTGIDFPGEANAQLQDINQAGPVGLATMGYGQGIAVTPIQLITAVSSIANDGKLMKPHLVKEIIDENGNVIKEFEPQQMRQSISQETSAEMRGVMEYVVAEGGATIAQIDGYRVGGKTGTANIEADDNKIVASFVGVAPMEDPQLAILYIVVNPQASIYGSTAAAPGGKEVLEQSLKYLNVPSTATEGEDEAKNYVTVPNITGKNFSQGKGELEGLKLVYKVSPETSEEDFVIKDQYPKPGKKIKEGGTVFIYHE